MKTTLKHASFMSLALTCLLTSCQSNNFDENLTDGAKVLQTISLNVIPDCWVEGGTRAGETTSEVTYPIHYYLYNPTTGKCISETSVSSADKTATLSASKGSYVVYALCGVQTGAPTQDNFSLSSFYNFATDNDVCIGHEKFEVSTYYGTSQSVQITASHVFAKLSLEVSNVPSEVSSVDVQLTPFYDQVSMNNEVPSSSTTSATQSFSLTKPKSGSTWTLAEKFYYPTSDKLVVTLTFTFDDESEKYMVATATGRSLVAGHSLKLSATYNSITTGSVSTTTSGWTDDDSFEWTLGGGNSSDTSSDTSSDSGSEGNNEKEDDANEDSSSEVTYKYGQKYEESYAMVVEQTGNEVLVMSTISYDNTKIQSHLTACSTEMNLSANWHVPSVAEWQKVIAGCSNSSEEFTSFLSTVNKNDYSYVNSSYYYMAASSESSYCYYQFGKEGNITNPYTADLYFYPVATITLTK